MAKQLRIKKSDIHGLGVFANEFIERASFISAMQLSRVGNKNEFSSLPVTGIIMIDDVFAVTGGFPLWYVNYSKEPNIEAVGNAIIAIRPIAKDDELTLKEPDATPNN